MQISVELDGDDAQVHDIYRYDPALEEWHESEFLGLTLEEAHQMIAAKSLQGVSN